MTYRYESTHRSLRAQRREREASHQTRSRPEEKVASGDFRKAITNLVDDGATSTVPRDVEPVSTLPFEAKNQGGQDESQHEDGDRDLVLMASPKERAESRRSRGSHDGGNEHAPKRRRSDRDDRSLSRPSPSSGGGRGNWSFTHSQPGSVVDDVGGLVTLLRHMKPEGLSFPAMSEMHQKEELRKVAKHLGQFLSSVNESFIGYETKLRDVPDVRELRETAAFVKEKIQELEEAKAKVSVLEKKNADLSLDVTVLSARKVELEKLRKASDQRITDMLVENTELSDKLLALEANKEVAVRRATKEGKREMHNAFKAVFATAKEKFEKKAAMSKAEAVVQEIRSNIELLEDIINKKIVDLKGEQQDLDEVELPKALLAVKASQVSDFSITKLNLPQISESVGTPMEVNPVTGAPIGMNQFGTNLEPVGAIDAGKADEAEKEDAPAEEVPGESLKT